MSGERLNASPAFREREAEPDLLPGTRRQVLAGTAAAGAMIAQLVFGKAARDALFLSTFPVSVLPAAMICAAVLSAIAVIVVSRAMTRHSPARVVPWLFVVNALLFVAESLLSVGSVQFATGVLYVHMGAFGATVISSFWSLVNERFDPHMARRAVGYIATGGTLGGILGSVIAWRLSHFLAVPALLLLLAVLNGLCFWGTRSLRTSTKHHEELRPVAEPVPLALGFSYLRDTAYLRHLGWLVAFAGVTSALLDYVLAARAATFASGRSLMAFFAVLYMSIALVGFLVQMLLTRTSLQRLGVSGSVTTLPVAVFAAGVAAFAVPGVVTVIALRAAEAVLQNSLFRSAYELLYTPIAPERKRSLKLIIDVGFERAGIAVGSAIALLVIWLLPGSVERLLLGGIVATATAGVLVARRLHAGYVSALEDSMRRRSVHLEETESKQETAQGAKNADARSEDVMSIRRLLATDELDPALAADLIPFLAKDELAHDVVRALRSIAPHVVAQLVAALLDPSQDAIVRRRIPRVLRACDSKLAVLGLTRALADGVFEIRHRCALALVSIAERKPDLSPSEAEVLAAVLSEVATDKQTWDSQRLQDALDEDDEHAADIMRDRSRSLAHVFTLLSLVYEREPLELAFLSLGSEDDRLRGTALEYLENVLPSEIHQRLRFYLGDLREYRRSARSRSELLDELQRLALQRADLGGRGPPTISVTN